MEQAKELIWQKTRGGEVSKVIIDLKPETPKPHQPRINYRITDNNLGHGGQKTKYGWNVAAIRLLNRLEKENRLATPEEQEILSRYVGWGGLPQAFDENNTQWAKEYAELKELLTEEEYASARASTLNAHYTSPTVIKAMYACLENMGFKTGNILEPACGIGNFFGLVPGSMKNSKLYGVELDSITGRIAKQLYQQANIAVQGFEETSLPDSFFDLAIGNVPSAATAWRTRNTTNTISISTTISSQRRWTRCVPEASSHLSLPRARWISKTPKCASILHSGRSFWALSGCPTMHFTITQVRRLKQTSSFCRSATA